mgnify:CR=1 FL=1
MKSILLAVFLLFALFSASSAENPPPQITIPCGSAETVKKLLEAHGEIVIFTGGREAKQNDAVEVVSMMIISLNQATGTWSHFEMGKNGMFCLLGAGSGGRLNIPGTRVNQTVRYSAQLG